MNDLLLKIAELTEDGNPIKECVCCHRQFNITQEFRDNLSLKEFHISGLCQKCQDEVFGV